MDELTAISLLSATPCIGPVRAKRLMQACGGARQALLEDVNNLATLASLSLQTLQAWKWWEKDFSWKADLELAEQEGVALIPFTSPSYPEKLRQLPDGPLLLYVKGALPKTDAKSIAIVGTRNCTLYGQEMAHTISRDLASLGFTIISGLARGIDAASHKGALETGSTAAVLGSGIANLYPKEHHLLAEKITERGAIISEFPMRAAPEKHHFPRRNRIVSGLSDAVLLIEAPQKSGAMITLEIAEKQGKKLYALPGRADLANYRGNHALLKQGRAELVETYEDIAKNCQKPSSIIDNQQFDEQEQMLLQLLPNIELSIDGIVKLTNLPIAKISNLLMSLIMKKAIKEYPGKIFKKVAH